MWSQFSCGTIPDPTPCSLFVAAFPTPDNMLTDMFNEIDIDKEGSVEFEVFLARMNYKIQGRFSTDVLKSMFRSVCAKWWVTELGSFRSHLG